MDGSGEIQSRVEAGESLRGVEVARLRLIEPPYREDGFDRVTRLAAIALEAPVAAFTVVDRGRQFIKSVHGAPDATAEQRLTHYAHKLLCWPLPDRRARPRLLEVEDIDAERSAAGEPPSPGESAMRFFAGLPVRSPAGFNVGALCALDSRPRRLTAAQREALADLVRMLEDQLSLRAAGHRDRMTGALTGSAFFGLAEPTWRSACRAGVPSALILTSIASGTPPLPVRPDDCDPVLRAVGTGIETLCSPLQCVVGRDRPHRFLTLLFNADGQRAQQLAERIYEHAREVGRRHGNELAPTLRIGVGCTASRVAPSGDRSLLDLVERAHAAVRRAQQQGGGCIYEE